MFFSCKRNLISNIFCTPTRGFYAPITNLYCNIARFYVKIARAPFFPNKQGPKQNWRIVCIPPMHVPFLYSSLLILNSLIKYFFHLKVLLNNYLRQSSTIKLSSEIFLQNKKKGGNGQKTTYQKSTRQNVLGKHWNKISCFSLRSMWRL